MNSDRIQCKAEMAGPSRCCTTKDRSSGSITSPNDPDRLLADGARMFRDEVKLRVTPYGSVVVVAGAPPAEAASGAATGPL